jgi:hypothetical protein
MRLQVYTRRDMLQDIRRRGGPGTSGHNSEPHLNEVLPYGRYGVGLLTGHPIGLVIVVGVIFMGLVGIPEARWFFGGSVVLGSIVGFLLWLRRR